MPPALPLWACLSGAMGSGMLHGLPVQRCLLPAKNCLLGHVHLRPSQTSSFVRAALW